MVENINAINIHKINPEMFIDKEHMMESWLVFSECSLTKYYDNFNSEILTKNKYMLE